MDISVVSTAAQAAGMKTKTMGKDEFLRLFVAQLKAQNPLSPLDSAGFTAQLAQFSSLEQLSNIANGVDNVFIGQISLQNTLTTGLINKQVKVDGEFRTVTGVAFRENGASLLLDNGLEIYPSRITEIKGGI